MEVLDQKIAIFDWRFGSAAVGRFHQLWSFPDEKTWANWHPRPTEATKSKHEEMGGLFKSRESSPQKTTPTKIRKSLPGRCPGSGILMENLPRDHERHFQRRSRSWARDFLFSTNLVSWNLPFQTKHIKHQKNLGEAKAIFSQITKGCFLWTFEL